MGQKSSNPQSLSTRLNISNHEFESKIDQRIKLGTDLVLRNIISQDELALLQTDYTSWNGYNNEYLKQSFDNPQNEYRKSYADAGYTFIGQMGDVPGNPILTLKNLINYKLTNLKDLKDKSELIKSEINTTSSQQINALSKTHVFIVHGRDEIAKLQAARLIEKLGFTPIILHEQSSAGKTIIEKIESYSNVGFGIVLYTACDMGAVQGEEANLKSRARQNVVFEHGFLIGKIGRKNVCALVKGDIETPNDISGVVYIDMNNARWEVDVAKELKESGYNVDMNKLF
ncbi:TIR domain-containing protein [Mucilaginibacter gossypii]|uniref:Predicted nucleotide-binding protein containing TIR-like domain-containing protein n=1 Tax=Mucilaginibacter gossypii TaxID=551996 RepID=A0A1G8FMR1_9SPHI|nr:nucleotide-binding protein [Mucilaginibacter gossypii]SDH83425.1 Predicted nucleotide-binding protein containing TIR-like domain-containing protein [Mucilaginibacter gossypii]